MKKNKYEYQEAENGLQALELYRADPPIFKVVLMDMSMPVMDGMTATRAIRQHEQNTGIARCRIVALTGLASASARLEALSSGVDHFMTKPVNFKALDELVRREGKRTDQRLGGDMATESEGSRDSVGSGESLDLTERETSKEREASKEGEASKERDVSKEREVSKERDVSKEREVSKETEASKETDALEETNALEGTDAFKEIDPSEENEALEHRQAVQADAQGDSSVLDEKVVLTNGSSPQERIFPDEQKVSETNLVEAVSIAHPAETTAEVTKMASEEVGAAVASQETTKAEVSGDKDEITPS
jgi:CheY-like chemotaxis protein